MQQRKRDTQRESKPWYREPWPWLLAAGPATVVVAGVITTAIAFASFDGVVADDYYKRGLAINRELAREQRSVELGITATAELRDGRVEVAIDARAGVSLPPSLRMRLVHPVKAERDQERVLAVTDPGRYSVAVSDLDSVRWQVLLDGPDWRLSTALRTASGAVPVAKRE